MHKITLLSFGLAFAFVPYSYGQSCTRSDVTVVDEKGIELGACKNPDNNTGKKFTYVSKANDACCEARTGRFKTLCINYSLCNGDTKVGPMIKTTTLAPTIKDCKNGKGSNCNKGEQRDPIGPKFFNA